MNRYLAWKGLTGMFCGNTQMNFGKSISVCTYFIENVTAHCQTTGGDLQSIQMKYSTTGGKYF